MDDTQIERLHTNGIVEIECHDFSDESLLALAAEYGRIVPGARGEIVQMLPVREKGEGPVGSFSYTVGYDAFPWHTDTAYWEMPVRYLLLASPSASPCATLYQDMRMIQKDVRDFDYLVSRAVFLLNIPGQRRYLSPFFAKDAEKGFRLDFHIYQPANEEAQVLMNEVRNYLTLSYNRYEWKGTNAVIIDNWRMIHGREAANNDTHRFLKRIYINELV